MLYATDEKINKKHGPGIIGIFSSTMGRYREFDQSKDSTIAPAGSRVAWAMGLNAAYNFNQIIRDLKPEEQWIWMQGDDHVWKPDLLLQLLERDVDIVAPLITRRSYPFLHVIHKYGKTSEEYSGGDFRGADVGLLDGKRGLIDISDYTIGNGGLLVRRQVFEAMSDPWFEVGKTHREFWGGDLWFSKKAKDAGFKLHIDLDNAMGHIAHMAIWPLFNPDGTFGVEIRPAADVYAKCRDYQDAKKQKDWGNYPGSEERKEEK